MGLDPLDIANQVSVYFFLSHDVQDTISIGIRVLQPAGPILTTVHLGSAQWQREEVLLIGRFRIPLWRLSHVFSKGVPIGSFLDLFFSGLEVLNGPIFLVFHPGENLL